MPLAWIGPRVPGAEEGADRLVGLDLADEDHLPAVGDREVRGLAGRGHQLVHHRRAPARPGSSARGRRCRCGTPPARRTRAASPAAPRPSRAPRRSRAPDRPWPAPAPPPRRARSATCPRRRPAPSGSRIARSSAWTVVCSGFGLNARGRPRMRFRPGVHAGILPRIRRRFQRRPVYRRRSNGYHRPRAVRRAMGARPWHLLAGLLLLPGPAPGAELPPVRDIAPLVEATIPVARRVGGVRLRCAVGHGQEPGTSHRSGRQQRQGDPARRRQGPSPRPGGRRRRGLDREPRRQHDLPARSRLEHRDPQDPRGDDQPRRQPRRRRAARSGRSPRAPRTAPSRRSAGSTRRPARPWRGSRSRRAARGSSRATGSSG